jgi:hypothetical protein
MQEKNFSNHFQSAAYSRYKEKEKKMIDREKMIAEIQESFAKIGAKPLSEKRLNEIIDEEIARFGG